MTRYYAVGQAMTTRERGSLFEGMFALKSRSLDADTVLKEAFPSGTVTKVFTSIEDAQRYANALHVVSHFPKTPGLGADAPIMTFDFLGQLIAPVKTEEIKTNEGPMSISYQATDLPFTDITPLMVEFPTAKIPVISLQQQSANKCAFM